MGLKLIVECCDRDTTWHMRCLGILFQAILDIQITIVQFVLNCYAYANAFINLMENLAYYAYYMV